MKKILMFVIVILAVLAVLGGCSLLGIGEPEPEHIPEVIVHGTTTGNILNYGFGVQYGDELIFRYSSEGAYPLGSIVRSNPETGENSLVLQDGGLYMSIVADDLYYCTPDGVYKTALENPEAKLVLGKDVALLQIADGNMYYIEDGAIDSSTLSGGQVDFARIENADCLNVYKQKIYYIGTYDGYIYSAAMDGSGSKLFFEKSVDMFYIMDDVVYFIDSVSGYIKSTSMDSFDVQTLVEYACYGFNINRNNMYYTRNINGIGTCCNAGIDGTDEETISDFGDSDWHAACMWDDGAILVRVEDLIDS